MSQEQDGVGGEARTGGRGSVEAAEDVRQERGSPPLDVGNVTLEQIGRWTLRWLRSTFRLNLTSLALLVTLFLACKALWNDAMGEQQPERAVRRMETKVDSMIVLLSGPAARQASGRCVVEPVAEP